MKLKYSITCIVILTFFQLHAQEKSEKIEHKNYVFNTPVKMQGADMSDDTLSFTEKKNATAYSKQGQLFKVVFKDDNYVYIHFFNYKDKNSQEQKKYVEDGTSKFFRVKKDIFEETTDKMYSRYAGETFGVVSIPFKIRLGADDFETNANIGLNLGLRYRWNRRLEDRWILQPIIGIGISDIPLNEQNSNVEEAENRTAMSLSLGLMLNISKDVNLGVFCGVDRLNKANQSVQWKYQDKGWFGIGINIGFGDSKSEDNKL
ncbi:MAG: hypothetical protein AAF617_12445, partial [Bacteroidota bacterium]